VREKNEGCKLKIANEKRKTKVKKSQFGICAVGKRYVSVLIFPDSCNPHPSPFGDTFPRGHL